MATIPPPRSRRLTPADVAGLKDGQQRYALLLNDEGGIKDDFMVARLPSERALHLVVNAATKESDFAYIAERLKGRAELKPLPTRALLALQGPFAEDVLARHDYDVQKLGFMKIGRFNIAGAPAIVSRSGYTGEDGFEISIAANEADHVARALLAEPEVKPIGLGARDSLRLEAGLCLYGHDIDETTSPIEAGLAFSIGKRRKMARDFPGGRAPDGRALRRHEAQARGPARAGQGARARRRRDRRRKRPRRRPHHQRQLRSERRAARSRWAMSRPNSQPMAPSSP